MKVIFNADDFGLTRGVNNGTVQSHKNGVVNSATLMVGAEEESHAVSLLSDYPDLKVGLHLRFTAGEPLTKHVCLRASKRLIGTEAAHGDEEVATPQFPKQNEFWSKRDFDSAAVYDEVVAQVERFLSLGIELSHIDSHHHAHTHPQILPVVERVANEYQVPLRRVGIPSLEQFGYRYLFTDKFYDEKATLDQLVTHLVSLKEEYDLVEVMCHPAYVDAHLESLSSYRHQRAQELNVLTDPRLKQRLHLHGIEVTDYSEFDSMISKEGV
ncbi:chitin disaccharide deacetylase [Vibrio amylolyticus]|uniref:chitin disaccharide deacetylase n=1 Tax=Vibrio amylolyticus TaxID=2847292 RepID=UPI00354BFB96